MTFRLWRQKLYKTGPCKASIQRSLKNKNILVPPAWMPAIYANTEDTHQHEGLPKHGKVGIGPENTSKHCQTLLTKYCARVFPDYDSGLLLFWLHTHNNRASISEKAPGPHLSPKEPWQWPEATSKSTCDVQDCRYLIVTEGETFGPKEWHWFKTTFR